MLPLYLRSEVMYSYWKTRRLSDYQTPLYISIGYSRNTHFKMTIHFTLLSDGFFVDCVFVLEAPGSLRAHSPLEGCAEVPLLSDDGVARNEGTAVLHLAPGCGPKDYTIGARLVCTNHLKRGKALKRGNKPLKRGNKALKRGKGVDEKRVVYPLLTKLNH